MKMKKAAKSMIRAFTLPDESCNDLISSLKHVMLCLHDEDDLKRGKVFHTLEGSMTKRIQRFEIHNSFRVDLLLVLQELSLLKTHGRGRSSVWKVADIAGFEEVTSERELEAAIQKVEEQHRRTTEIRTLREKLSNDSPSQNNDVDPELLTEIAGLAADLEDEKKQNVGLQKTIKQLEKDLKNQPKAPSLIDEIKKIRKK